MEIMIYFTWCIHYVYTPVSYDTSDTCPYEANAGQFGDDKNVWYIKTKKYIDPWCV